MFTTMGVTTITPLKGFELCETWGRDWKMVLGENMVKGAKNAKVKVIFQGLHMTRVIFVLIYNFKFCILGTPFNTTFKI